MDHPEGSTRSTRLLLDLRGVRFDIERETLMNLPESILLCLFPNGLLLSDPEGDESGGEPDDEQVYFVDFDARCLEFVLAFFRHAQDYFYGTETTRGVYGGFDPAPQLVEYGTDPITGATMSGYGHPFHFPLFYKQAVIVLREELEFYTIPPRTLPSARAAPGAPENALPHATPAFATLREICGDTLLQRRKVFSALQRNVNKESNVAEQHLIDMLCMSGFDPEDNWGYRAREPGRSCITSTALVLLKTGITHEAPADARAPPEPPSGVTREAPPPPPADPGEWVYDEHGSAVRVNQQQLNTAQKLLLFWRKPARKCWWDNMDLVVPAAVLGAGTPQAPRNVYAPVSRAAMTRTERELLDRGAGRIARVWARRVWTLEVGLVRHGFMRMLT